MILYIIIHSLTNRMLAIAYVVSESLKINNVLTLDVFYKEYKIALSYFRTKVF